MLFLKSPSLTSPTSASFLKRKEIMLLPLSIKKIFEVIIKIKTSK